MSKLKTILTNICRIVLALTFIFSGYVKAIDPLGTQYKIEDYLGALSLQSYIPEWMVLIVSVLIAAIEFSLGIFMLFAIRRRQISKLVFAFMVAMTLITVWLVIANPISDCGCFGDAVKLTNVETLLKNVVLLTCAVVVMIMPLRMVRFISKSNQWIVINYTILFILFTSGYCLYNLPVFDFRPYHVGADIKKGMEIPKGAKQPKFDTTFILEKNGEKKEFTLDNYPDSTWTFIDSKTIQIEEGYVPPIHDFSIQTEDGDDITADLLDNKDYTFLLISPHLETANDLNFDRIDQISEYSIEQKIPFYCLTASGDEAVKQWTEMTGAEYQFYKTDDTTLKTIIRSNPGLLLLKDGKIIRKWSHNNLPTRAQLNAPMSKLEIGQMPSDSVTKKILYVFMLFVLPLVLLTIADRIWAWSTWVKLKKKKEKDKIYQLLKKKKENEKENCSR